MSFIISFDAFGTDFFDDEEANLVASTDVPLTDKTIDELEAVLEIGLLESRLANDVLEHFADGTGEVIDFLDLKEVPDEVARREVRDLRIDDLEALSEAGVDRDRTEVFDDFWETTGELRLVGGNGLFIEVLDLLAEVDDVCWDASREWTEVEDFLTEVLEEGFTEEVFEGLGERALTEVIEAIKGRTEDDMLLSDSWDKAASEAIWGGSSWACWTSRVSWTISETEVSWMSCWAISGSGLAIGAADDFVDKADLMEINDFRRDDIDIRFDGDDFTEVTDVSTESSDFADANDDIKGISEDGTSDWATISVLAASVICSTICWAASVMGASFLDEAEELDCFRDVIDVFVDVGAEWTGERFIEVPDCFPWTVDGLDLKDNLVRERDDFTEVVDFVNDVFDPLGEPFGEGLSWRDCREDFLEIRLSRLETSLAISLADSASSVSSVSSTWPGLTDPFDPSRFEWTDLSDDVFLE